MRTGKEMIERGEEMVERGHEMLEHGKAMREGETVVFDGHEMKKREMVERGREMIERGNERIEKGRAKRKYDIVWRAKRLFRDAVDGSANGQEPNLWRALGNIPVTVGVVVGISVWLVLEGIVDTTATYDSLVNPFYYVELLFVHASTEQFVSSMYFFVPAGIALTYFTNNKTVFNVVAVSHVAAVLVTGVVLDSMFTGTTAAAYGLLAAVAVRAAYIGSKNYSATTQTAAPTGILVVASVGILMIGAAGGSLIQNMPVVVGFAAGGAYETMRVVGETRKTETVDDWRGSAHGQ